MKYLSKPYTDEQYAEFVTLEENQGRILKEDSDKVWFEDQPEPSIAEKTRLFEPRGRCSTEGLLTH